MYVHFRKRYRLEQLNQINEGIVNAKQDEFDRIPLEGKFGQGKRRFDLARIMGKLSQTSETMITVTFIVMNLEELLRGAFFSLFILYSRHLVNPLEVLFSFREEVSEVVRWFVPARTCCQR